jgi:branched-chain amino acid transport system permease protein
VVDPSLLITVLVIGLLWGLIFSIVALGLVLITGVAKLVHFGHGAYILFASYLSLTLYQLHIDPFLSLAIIIPAFFLFGILVELPMRPIYRLRLSLSEFQLIALILTFAIATIINGTEAVIWGGKTEIVLTPLTTSTLTIAGLSLPTLVVMVAAIGGVAALALRVFLTRSDIGNAIRFTGEDSELASLVGINTTSTRTLVYGLHAAFCGLSGALLSMLVAFYPGSDTVYLLTAFAVMILAGLGSVEGTVISAIIISVAQSFVVFLLFSAFAPAAGMIILIAVLLIRPEGLLGKRVR